MRAPDLLRFATRSLAGARTRTLLMLLAMSIGVASVVGHIINLIDHHHTFFTSI